jgi:hypothetical protein
MKPPSISAADVAPSAPAGESGNKVIAFALATLARGTGDAPTTPSMPAVFRFRHTSGTEAANSYMPDKCPSGAANPISDPSIAAVPLSRASSATAAATAGATSRLNTDGMM